MVNLTIHRGRTMGRWINAALGLACLGLASVGAAQAEALYNTPIHDEATGSYFELARVTAAERARSGRDAKVIDWSFAARLAANRTYDGRRGRLAVIDSPQIHDFVRSRLRPDKHAWFGLRYWCRHRVLQWTSGKIHPFTGFGAWMRNWNGGHGCKQDVYLPVAYTPVSRGFRWIAKGEKKEFTSFLVEYPAEARGAAIR